MTFLLTWSSKAMDQFHKIVAAADDPARIRAASDHMDYALRRYPFDMGESRDRRDYRLWYGDVLGVLYQVDDRAMTVRIVSVSLARRR